MSEKPIRLSISLPLDVHAAIAEMAREDGRTLNKQIAWLLSQAIARDADVRGMSRLAGLSQDALRLVQEKSAADLVAATRMMGIDRDMLYSAIEQVSGGAVTARELKGECE